MKKTRLISTIAAVLLVVTIATNTILAYSGGSGTLGAPYQIANKADLLQLAGDTGNYGKYFVLTADIDMSGQVFTTAIIAESNSLDGNYHGTIFTGVFDGNGHKITNFTINGGTTCYLALFGFVGYGGEVKNLGVEDATTSGDYAVAGLAATIEEGLLTNCYAACSVTGTSYVGGLVGDSYQVTLTNCHAAGSVSGGSSAGGLIAYNRSGTLTSCYATGSVSGNNTVGGLAGINNGTSTITNCYATGTVTGTGYYVGGLVGLNNDTSTITNSYSTGTVSGTESTGGLAGYNGGPSTLISCHATGSVSGTDYVGGLVGHNPFGILTTCYATGSVSGSSVVGGLVGYNRSGILTSCYATGSVSGPQDLGGLVGYNESGNVTSCYATGSVSGTGNYIGGLVGGTESGNITSCYAAGAVSGTTYVGGLLGWSNNSTPTDCFWDTQTSGQMTSAAGTGKTTTEMKTLSTFTNAGWDFVGETDNGTDDIWKIADNGTGYPKLSWERIVYPFGTIPGQKNIKLTLMDCDGNNVTFSLTGGGYGEIDAYDCNFSTIVLHETTDKSALTISTKGKVYTNVGSITCNGPMKSITAKTATISGDIIIGSSSNPKSAVTITFAEGDGATISSSMPIKAISTTDWWGWLTTPSVGSITTKSAPKLDKAGYMAVDVNVTGTIGTVKVADGISGSWNCKSIKSIAAFSTDDFYLTLSQEPNVKMPALGNLTLKQGFYWSRIISSGNIGTFTVAAMRQASCFAGVADACMVNLNADDVCDLPPVLDNTFNQTATIKSIMIKGIKGDDATYFVNSNIAAATVSSMSIAYPEYNNGGIPFGITMWNDPKAFTIKDANGTHSWKGSDIGTAKDWLTANGGDMQIRRD